MDEGISKGVLVPPGVVRVGKPNVPVSFRPQPCPWLGSRVVAISTNTRDIINASASVSTLISQSQQGPVPLPDRYGSLRWLGRCFATCGAVIINKEKENRMTNQKCAERDRVPRKASAANVIRVWIGVCVPVLVAAAQLVTALRSN